MATDDFIERLRRNTVDWRRTAESRYTFQAVFEGELVKMRLNDFPAEPICTVIHGGQEIDIEPFPETWTLPGNREQCGDQS